MRNLAFRLWWAHHRRVRLWFWLSIGVLGTLLTSDWSWLNWASASLVVGISGATLLLDYLSWKMRF